MKSASSAAGPLVGMTCADVVVGATSNATKGSGLATVPARVQTTTATGSFASGACRYAMPVPAGQAFTLSAWGAGKFDCSVTHRNGKRVAVKVLHPHLASIAEVRDRFLREGYLANRVAHPGAVGVLDDDVTEDGLVFFVMDLLDGESLEKRLEREGPLATADVLAIASNLLDVLAAAHAKGIVHRDIKPENIYLLHDGGQRLLDFGIARLHEQTATKNATQTGAAMGTPAYMPPEQARGRWEMVDARSDLWAVGATMFTLLTGRCVHDGATINETLLLAMAAPAPALASVWPEVPKSLAAQVDRALATEMNDRWPDAVTMRAAVLETRAALASLPAMPARPAPATKPTLAMPQLTPSRPGRTMLAASVSKPPPGPTGLLGKVAIGVGAAAAAVGLAMLLALGHGKTTPPGAASSPPSPPAMGGPPAEPLPTVTLAPEPAAVAASASSDAPQPPAPTVTGAVDVASLPLAPAPPAGAATTAPPARPRPPAPPTSNPLDRRH